MSSHSYDYSRDYLPSAPIVDLQVFSYDTTIQPIQVSAFIDSGADGTMVPINILRSLNAQHVGQKLMRGVINDVSLINLYLVKMSIGDITIQGVEAVALPDSSECILGRDVLNQLQVTLDGLGAEVRIWDYND